MPANGNLAFAENLVDQLTGDSNLIAVRSRASRERPFTVVKKMQADAEASYRSKIKELEGSLADTQRKIRSCRVARKASVYPFARATAGTGEFPKKEVEAKSQLKSPQETARRHRFAREADRVARYRRDAGARRPDGSGFGAVETQALASPMNRTQLAISFSVVALGPWLSSWSRAAPIRGRAAPVISPTSSLPCRSMRSPALQLPNPAGR